jgi:hypothetical protein
MKVKPMLGSFALDSIEYIESSESRALVEHRVPGLEGSYFQDMGSVPNTIVIVGTKHGDEARDTFLEGIREIFNAGEPTTFVADINTATDITEVVIEDLQVAEVANSPNSFRYMIKIRKYIKPPEPPATGLLDGGILDDALSLTDALDLIDGLGSIPDLGDPTQPLRQALDGVKSGTSGLDQTVNDLQDLFGEEAPSEDLHIDPADPRIDGATGSTLESMLQSAETAEDAARLVQGINDGTLAGILGDDSDVVEQLAGAYGVEPSSLVPPGQDAALVLDAASPLEAPPTIVLRSGTPDVRDDPARLSAALQEVGRTFDLFQRGELGPCDSTPSAIPVANLMPSTFCQVPPGTPGPEEEKIDPSAPDLQIDPADPNIDVGAKFALQRMLKVPGMDADAACLLRGINGKFLFSVGLEAENDLNNGIISVDLRRKFEDNKIPLSDDASVSKETNTKWLITDGNKTYIVKKQGGKLNIYSDKTLAGIFGDDLGVAVKVARAHGTERWLLVPKGQDAALVLDAAAPLDPLASPTVIFRGDTPDIRDKPIRIDPALQKASQTFALWHRQLCLCTSSPSAIPVPNLVPPSYCRLPQTKTLRLRLLKDDRKTPYGSKKVVIAIDGIEMKPERTDNEGFLVEEIPMDARNVQISLWEDDTADEPALHWDFEIQRKIPSPDTVRGALIRLRNLNYYTGVITDETTEEARESIGLFQWDWDLDITMELDDPTVQKLKQVHDIAYRGE